MTVHIVLAHLASRSVAHHAGHRGVRRNALQTSGTLTVTSSYVRGRPYALKLVISPIFRSSRCKTMFYVANNVSGPETVLLTTVVTKTFRCRGTCASPMYSASSCARLKNLASSLSRGHPHSAMSK
ncbi:uncharacterized protein C8Q71DRAFT_465146 [Rhodofomes roseus]|uniref:Secreted protein n=1 Tax=Rhodofomes roseus TaxID=34475 RepID=A0ABQ8KN65_9APHY|nr:uncharacterized protein C8Q71DRAFT_465146 [Rhodofomes roseus]KAH9839849.1 hypothetical protein C8Q71DRAFT_465146 [Rhodofomes roseus]